MSGPRREWQIPEDEDGSSILDRMENLDETLIPDKALDDAATRQMILDLVDSLPPEQRMSVLLYYYDEMSVKEIAQAMEVSEGTVKSRLNYARKAIKKGVEEHERQGVKLYSAAPMLLLIAFLRRDASQCALEGPAAAEMAKQVMAQAGAAGQAAGSAAAGAASGSAAASGAGAAVSGLSLKVIAGVLAGVIAAAGIGVMVSHNSRDGGPPPAAEQTDAPAPVQDEGDSTAFAAVHGFVIAEPQAYEGLPLTLLLDDPELPVISSASALTRPEISVSEPDGTGYVTYTVTYDVTAQALLGSAGEQPAFTGSILAQEYNLYDYYTGRLYQPDGPETGASGETRASGSALIERDGAEFELFFEKSWRSGLDTGQWTAGQQSDFAWERAVNADMSVTITVQAPAEYDGLLIGLNITDPADPYRQVQEDWDLSADEPSHFRFNRLWRGES